MSKYQPTSLGIDRYRSVPARTAPRSHRITVNGTLLLLAIGVLMAAAALRINGDQKVVTPVFAIELPGTCTFRRLFATDCPGCGLTRCFISAADGDLPAAWSFNPVGIVLFGFVLSQVPYRLLQIWRLRRGLSELRLHRHTEWMLVVLAAALIIQWIIRVFVSSS